MYHDLSLSFPASASFPAASSSRSGQGAAGAAAKGKGKGKGKEKELPGGAASAAPAEHDALAALSSEQHRRLHALTADMAERECTAAVPGPLDAKQARESAECRCDCARAYVGR
jgi:hypothetical protein